MTVCRRVSSGHTETTESSPQASQNAFLKPCFPKPTVRPSFRRPRSMLFGYARISTQDQSNALQRNALETAGCERIFEETASGDQRTRPRLAAALDYAREGDALVVWRLDSLAGSLRKLIETVEDLNHRGIGLRSLTEAIDTTTSGGRLVFHVFGALAEFERSLISERTRAGLEAARVRGRVGGRPPALSAEDLAAARAMLRDPEITVAAVAARVGVSQSTLYRHLPAARTAAQRERTAP